MRRHRRWATSHASDNDRDEHGRDLGDGEGELPHGERNERSRLAEVLAQPVVRALGHLDEQHEGDGADRPQDDPDDVAGMAVVALTGWTLVEGRSSAAAVSMVSGVVELMSSRPLRRRRRPAARARTPISRPP